MSQELAETMEKNNDYDEAISMYKKSSIFHEQEKLIT